MIFLRLAPSLVFMKRPFVLWFVSFPFLFYPSKFDDTRQNCITWAACSFQDLHVFDAQTHNDQPLS